ncbi:hypothetical protein LDO31_15745 [Luteimonas sp. XNQY3]|nr:hypothetical protein [Luteimonas sp. XNQY3]MCD9007662.1 hypothetical protein [Luteimonas sp. XNQY3]
MKGCFVAALLLLGATPAIANPAGTAHVEFVFGDADANRVGMITQADFDKDGQVMLREARIWHGPDAP